MEKKIKVNQKVKKIAIFISLILTYNFYLKNKNYNVANTNNVKATNNDDVNNNYQQQKTQTSQTKKIENKNELVQKILEKIITKQYDIDEKFHQTYFKNEDEAEQDLWEGYKNAISGILSQIKTYDNGYWKQGMESFLKFYKVIYKQSIVEMKKEIEPSNKEEEKKELEFKKLKKQFNKKSNVVYYIKKIMRDVFFEFVDILNENKEISVQDIKGIDREIEKFLTLLSDFYETHGAKERPLQNTDISGLEFLFISQHEKLLKMLNELKKRGNKETDTNNFKLKEVKENLEKKLNIYETAYYYLKVPTLKILLEEGFIKTRDEFDEIIKVLVFNLKTAKDQLNSFDVNKNVVKNEQIKENIKKALSKQEDLFCATLSNENIKEFLRITDDAVTPILQLINDIEKHKIENNENVRKRLENCLQGEMIETDGKQGNIYTKDEIININAMFKIQINELLKNYEYKINEIIRKLKSEEELKRVKEEENYKEKLVADVRSKVKEIERELERKEMRLSGQIEEIYAKESRKEIVNKQKEELYGFVDELDNFFNEIIKQNAQALDEASKNNKIKSDDEFFRLQQLLLDRQYQFEIWKKEMKNYIDSQFKKQQNEQIVDINKISDETEKDEQIVDINKIKKELQEKFYQIQNKKMQEYDQEIKKVLVSENQFKENDNLEKNKYIEEEKDLGKNKYFVKNLDSEEDENEELEKDESNNLSEYLQNRASDVVLGLYAQIDKIEDQDKKEKAEKKMQELFNFVDNFEKHKIKTSITKKDEKKLREEFDAKLEELENDIKFLIGSDVLNGDAQPGVKRGPILRQLEKINLKEEEYSKEEKMCDLMFNQINSDLKKTKNKRDVDYFKQIMKELDFEILELIKAQKLNKSEKKALILERKAKILQLINDFAQKAIKEPLTDKDKGSLKEEIKKALEETKKDIQKIDNNISEIKKDEDLEYFNQKNLYINTTFSNIRDENYKNIEYKDKDSFLNEKQK